VLSGVAQAGQDRHHADAGQDPCPGDLLHGHVTLLRAEGQVLHLADPLVSGRIRGRDHAEKDDGRSALVDLLEQIEVTQDKKRALQDRDGKAQLQAHLQDAPRHLELLLGRLVVAGGDDVDGQRAQDAAQEVGGVLLGLDDVAKVVQVIKGVVFALATVAVLSDTIN
jgi:hypothetical protein